MTWLDYRKTHELFPHSLINECMELFGIADKVRKFLEKCIEQWKLSRPSNSEDSGEIDVKRGIIQEDSLLPLLFVLSMVPLSVVDTWENKPKI